MPMPMSSLGVSCGSYSSSDSGADATSNADDAEDDDAAVEPTETSPPSLPTFS